MKLVISKNKDNTGYYSKIKNEYNNEKTEMYLSIQLGKNIGELEYGMYDIDGFMSCYKAKDGSVKPKLIITSAVPISNPTKKQETKAPNPFEEFGNEIDINDNMLD